jgi:hypothetical protein
MMQIPACDIEPFLLWTHETTGILMTVDADYPMSAKVYASYSGPEKGMLASFTTIVPDWGRQRQRPMYLYLC